MAGGCVGRIDVGRGSKWQKRETRPIFFIQIHNFVTEIFTVHVCIVDFLINSLKSRISVVRNTALILSQMTSTKLLKSSSSHMSGNLTSHAFLRILAVDGVRIVCGCKSPVDEISSIRSITEQIGLHTHRGISEPDLGSIHMRD